MSGWKGAAVVISAYLPSRVTSLNDGLLKSSTSSTVKRDCAWAGAVGYGLAWLHVFVLAPQASFEVITSEHMIPTPLRVVVTGALSGV